MRYEGMVYRPPSEAYSLIVQATVGCSHNKCTFCSMYKDDSFKIKPVSDIKDDLLLARDTFNYVRRVFIADGDALAMKQEDLVEILTFIKEVFPESERVGIYGSPKSILRKDIDDFKQLKSLGLGIIYLGVESGSDEILKRIKKGVTKEEMIAAGRIVKSADIPLSITLISGMGGKELTNEHSLESADIINQISPDYVGLLTLMLNPKTELYEQVESGEFEILTPYEVLLETKLMVENIDVKDCTFRANHASNYVNLRGVLSQEKSLVLSQIERGLEISNLEARDKFRRL